MSMLESFFNIEKDSKNLFSNLTISQNKKLCSEWMNQYPTISISFNDVHGRHFKLAYDYLKREIADLFKQYTFLLDSDKIDVDDKNIFAEIKSLKAEEADLGQSLKLLSRLLFNYYNKPVILLLDEYDVPLAKASKYGYYNDMLDIMRALMQVLKDNNYLKFAVITGCLRISKESIFTGVNNFRTNTISSRRFNEYFGFTEEEVIKLLNDTGMSSKYPLLKEWYDGYNFGGIDIYCPWDVISYLDDILDDDSIRPGCYWNKTSGNSIIRTFIDEYHDSIRENFETLLTGRTIRVPIYEDLTYDLLHSSEDNFWSVLYLTGYITSAPNDTFDSEEMSLRIPNKEIKEIFKNTIQQWFKVFAPTLDRRAFFKAILEKDTITITQEMNTILLQTISYFDYSEDFYHAFLAGIFVGVGQKVTSNDENGLGRSDIVIKFEQKQCIVIFEVKYSQEEKDMEADCNKALKQIKDKKYADIFRQGKTEVICYGISFHKKNCLVKLES